MYIRDVSTLLLQTKNVTYLSENIRSDALTKMLLPLVFSGACSLEPVLAAPSEKREDNKCKDVSELEHGAAACVEQRHSGSGGTKLLSV